MALPPIEEKKNWRLDNSLDWGICPKCGKDQIERVLVENVFSPKGPQVTRSKCRLCTDVIWGGLYRERAGYFQ